MTNIIPGKIVFLDNKEDEVIPTIMTFLRSGESINYFQRIPEIEKIPSNIRLLIIDLALTEEQIRPDEDFPLLAQFLKNIILKTKLCYIVLWSRHIDNTDENFIDQIKNEYRDQNNSDIPSTIYFTQFGKRIDKRRLISKIKQWMGDNPSSALVFDWEKIIEDSMDSSVSDIVGTGEIQTIVKSFERQIGKKSLPREITLLFNKILTRYSTSETKNKILKKHITKILNQQEIPDDTLEWYRKVYSLSAYYKIHKNEPIWTGDIFQTTYQDPAKGYAIVINPVCDFAQKRINHIKVIFGFRFSEINDYRPNTTDDIPPIVEKIGKIKRGNFRSRRDFIKMIFSGDGLPQKFYILHYIDEEITDNNYFHLLLDFHHISSINYDPDKKTIKPKGWKRVCRLDSPWIDEILQRYAAQSFRIGKPDIPDKIIDLEILSHTR